MRVVTVVGTRPEVIRLSRVMAELDNSVDHKVIHTGQNFDYELNEIFFNQMGIRRPDVQLSIHASSPSEFVGNAMMLLVHPLQQINPDALLILGDTNSCFAAAYVAKRLKIPVFHMEAGNRCFDQRVPEEINRGVVDRLSDINLPYSDLARENLIRENFPSDRVIKTGSPMNEVLYHYSDQINKSDVTSRLNLKHGEFFVVSCHREENVEKYGVPYHLLETLVHKYGKRIIFSTHPRLRPSVESGVASPLIEFHRPFGFFDFVKLQQHAYCTLSDSGTITEESSILNFPALNLRESHERPEGMEQAAVMMTGLDTNRILDSIPIACESRFRLPVDYAYTDVSKKVVRIILSYTDYVNRVVWGR